MTLFRPCIDLHEGAVKQIVGGSLRDESNSARENFVSANPPEFYAELYRKDGLKGGHVIIEVSILDSDPEHCFDDYRVKQADGMNIVDVTEILAERKKKLTKKDKENLVKTLLKEMQQASRAMEFERAAELRDMILELDGTLPKAKGKE